MISDPGAGDNAGAERKGRADRQFHREYVVLRSLISLNDEAPLSCGLMDISVGGAKVKLDYGEPKVGDKVFLIVESISFKGRGHIIRTFYTPTGLEIAIKWNELQADVPAKMLQYKIRSHRNIFSRSRR